MHTNVSRLRFPIDQLQTKVKNNHVLAIARTTVRRRLREDGDESIKNGRDGGSVGGVFPGAGIPTRAHGVCFSCALSPIGTVTR